MAGSRATARHRLQVQPTWRPLRAPRGESGAMVPARWEIAGAGEAGSPFQGKGQVARLGRSEQRDFVDLPSLGFPICKVDMVGGNVNISSPSAGL